MTNKEIDFRNLLLKKDFKPKKYLKELDKTLEEHLETSLYPPQFHVIIHRKEITSEDLNLSLKIDNADPLIYFHIATFSGTDI